MKSLLLDILSLGAVFSSVLVITSKNPVIAVVFLISLFVNTAGYLIVLGIGFVGISYIIIYIGAITVLFLFIIMMINIKLVDILEIGSEYTKNLPLAIILGVLFVYEVFSILPFTFNNIALLNIPIDVLNYLNCLMSGLDFSSINPLNNSLSESLLSDSSLNNNIQIEVLAQVLYTYGSTWLLICSFILLLSMLSAIFLSTIKKS